ncbi:beta-L-arabinofuranosidase domain-containing protein [Virgibacillus oceani]|uniref:Glycosyl hydrolase n=1 Tax=Virgibacillus oceani TaxID=1479511 RepID=A0A917HAD5_9BACI|nr:beta-L-arabinofuranosidase domain-containing protein [Virgibacillus oceani]GGG72730.1 hypothetical protein GCM10011398_16350 [Virgibacillus oceani]
MGDFKLIDSKFRSLPLGSIKPEGWLRNQLKIQRDGLTGHLEEHWEDVGPNNGWLGGDGDSWERGPYYLDGLVPLAYLLEDEQLLQKAKRWIEWTLSSQKEDGSFGPNHFSTINTEADFNVHMNKQDWWQDVIMLKVLTQYQEASNDERVIPFMTRYFRYLNVAIVRFPLKEWSQARGADLLLSIHWLYEKTNDDMLLNLAETVRTQTIDWTRIFSNFPYKRKQTEWDHRVHVVNVAMATKAPALFFRQTGEDRDRDAAYKGIESLMTYHGQANGMFSGDEWLSGTHPSQGTELCAVVEYMFSMENLVRILGNGRFADILEKVVFNALPATISPAWDAHQYDQQVNQIMCNAANRPWVNGPDANTFGLEPHFGCCTANMHQGWPKFTASLWMATEDQGLAAISYAPCHVKTTVADGRDVELLVGGAYPFREQVSIKIRLSDEAAFPIFLRIPNWCSNQRIKINGELLQVNAEDGFARINRVWKNNDRIDLVLPMEVRVEERNNYAISVTRGPLVFALPIEEQWIRTQKREKFHDWEVYPSSPWQYALEKDFDVQLNGVSYQPFRTEDAPVKLVTKGRLLSNWIMEKNSAGSPPLNPKPYNNAELKGLELVPYGCARLRIGEFPVLDK